jgi:chromate transporter
MIYLKLFWEFALIGLFSFGGGYAMIPMLQKTVSEYGWLTAEQLSRIIVIAEMTPGPIAVNAATFVGYNTGGFLGGIVATLGVALPSMLIIFLVSRLFIKYKSHPDKIMAFYGIRPVITGMVIAASFVIAKTALFTEKTVAVFSGLFRAFTEDDPDGNGVDDTAAYPESNTWYERTIYGMFGIDKNNNVFYLDELTGNVVPYYAHSYYRDYLVWLSQMLEKGYVKTLPGLDAAVDELASALSTGKFGFFNMRISRINTNYGNDVGTWPPLTILENIDPQARFVITPYMGENGGLIPYGYTPAQSNRAFIFGADVSDKKMARILQLYEYSCFGEDWMRYRFGIEGVHYKWSGEPYKSAMIFTPLDKIPKKYAGSVDMGQFGNTNFHIATGAVMNYEPTFLQWMEYYHSRYTYDEILLRPYKLYDYSTMPIEVYEEFQKLYQETGSQIFAVRNDFTNRVMKGGVANINAEWSQYLEQLYSAGLEDWIEIWNSDRIITYSDLVNPKS